MTTWADPPHDTTTTADLGRRQAAPAAGAREACIGAAVIEPRRGIATRILAVLFPEPEAQ
jgi:hypothetical protein